MQKNIKNLCVISIFTALLCVTSFIVIPAGIPITLQTFVVFLAVGLLGLKKSLVAVIVYILIGLLGLPVFAGFKGGFAALFSETGGFIIGFLFVCIIKGITKNIFKNFILSEIFSSVIALLFLYTVGSIWFCIVFYNKIDFNTFASSLVVTVLPFLLPDIIKIIVAAYLTKRINKGRLII